MRDFYARLFVAAIIAAIAGYISALAASVFFTEDAGAIGICAGLAALVVILLAQSGYPGEL